MDINELELFRNHLTYSNNFNTSPRTRLFELNKFLTEILKFGQYSIYEAYFAEFVNEYKTLLLGFDSSGLSPNYIQILISNLSHLMKLDKSEEDILGLHLKNLEEKYKEITDILDGNSVGDTEKIISFPVLEKADNSNVSTGFLENFTISIRYRSGLTEDKFIIVPSFGEIDNRLEEQIKVSWNFAKSKIIGRPSTKAKYHEVVIQFDKKYGIYEGDSLGIALTICFIEEIAKRYNSRSLVKVNSKIVATGSVDLLGKIHSVEKEIIEKKTEAAFYSNTEIFIVPEKDKLDAQNHYLKLSELYPKRRLEIIGADNINEILDRRSVINFKRQSFTIWTGKKVIKNKLAMILLLFIIISSSEMVFLSVDNNPYNAVFENGKLSVTNKYGKMLWEIKSELNYDIYGTRKNQVIQKHVRIIDIDGDGLNEVFSSRENVSSVKGLVQYDSEGNMLKTFSFKKVVESTTEKFTENYNIVEISEIIETENGFEAVIIAGHENYYPSFILRLNLNTFELIGEPFIHSGHVKAITVGDVDNDGEIELLCGAISNGYRRSAFFIIELNELHGTGPTVNNYRIKGFNVAKFDHHILMPMSDYCELTFPKYNSILQPPYLLSSVNQIRFSVAEGSPNTYRKFGAGFTITFKKDLTDAEIIVADQMVIERDQYINSGQLNLPYTDTDEFRGLLKQQVKKWDGEKFVQMFK